ncbi:hypothetical protein NS365_07785 [Aureimonas ureilytica]|uniref:Allantoate amidohydrolase n=1 Tax=Aureimonas ureilytica TaxID=401562 RepID=A0A175RS47_9HYPH|nr:hypothetical protein [Aureimonas ureilytica]KTR06307.1 hypothetical protein NS365_07785 [Aureimonas ureilytica]
MTGDGAATTVERALWDVNALGAGGSGFTRRSDSPAESEAHAVIADECAALGLEVTRDAALHLDARLPGCDRSAPPIHVGSHLDTVPMGSVDDGLAGGVRAAALLAQAGREAVMICRRKGNASHTLDEGMDPADPAQAVQGLHRAVGAC